MFRKMAGYILHRTLGELSDLIKRKEQQSYGHQKAFLDCKAWIEQCLLAERSEVLSEEGIGEIGFFQNERYALKHVTNEFFYFIRDLDKLWCKKFQDGYANCVLDAQHTLLTSKDMKDKFFSLCGHLSNSDREGKCSSDMQYDYTMSNFIDRPFNE